MFDYFQTLILGIENIWQFLNQKLWRWKKQDLALHLSFLKGGSPFMHHSSSSLLQRWYIHMLYNANIFIYNANTWRRLSVWHENTSLLKKWPFKITHFPKILKTIPKGLKTTWLKYAWMFMRCLGGTKVKRSKTAQKTHYEKLWNLI